MYSLPPMRPVAFEIRRLTQLAAPLVVALVAAMTLWIVDIVMLGRVGVDALDAASLGRIWLVGTTIPTMGLLLGIDPIAAQAHGAGNRRELVLAGQRGLVVVVLLTPLWAAVLLATGPALEALGQSAELAHLAERYVLAQLPGLPFFFGYVVLRHWLQAQGILRPILWATITANGVNALADWVLIFGHLGFPELGVVGAGAATGLTFLYLFGSLALGIHASGAGRGEWRRWPREVLAPRAIGRLLALGAPVGLQISFEYWAFAIATLWAGWLGAAPLAAHTVVLSVASLTFMVPMGVSFAAVTRVGNLLGAGDRQGAQRAAWVAMGLGGGAMTASGIGLVLGRHLVPAAYSDDPAVIALCAAILPIAGAFQLSDGLQVVGSGVLRGMGRTVPAALFNLLGFYLVALPLAWLLAFRAGLGLTGIWWGLASGLTAVAALLAVWIHRRGPAHAPLLDAR